MSGIIDELPSDGIPATMNSEDQGRFIIGYYHQRQALFAKKVQPNETKGEEKSND
jgi:CRISPR-associated protein Csd1